MPRAYTVVLLAFGLLAQEAHAQSEADSAAIRGIALDYVEGWYTGDATRMWPATCPHLPSRDGAPDGAAGERINEWRFDDGRDSDSGEDG